MIMNYPGWIAVIALRKMTQRHVKIDVTYALRQRNLWHNRSEKYSQKASFLMASDDPHMSIREMCEMFDVTPRTLRFYEQKELLFPLRDGQRRLFTRRDRARLKLILRGKRFGFALEEIRQLLELYGKGDSQYAQITRAYDVAGDRLADLKARRADLDSAIEDLEAQMKWGERMLASLEIKAPDGAQKED